MRGLSRNTSLLCMITYLISGTLLVSVSALVKWFASLIVIQVAGGMASWMEAGVGSQATTSTVISRF